MEINYRCDYYRTCPVCGSKESQLVKTVNEKSHGQVNVHNLTTNISICSQCGFIFSNPSISQEDYNMYYNDMITYYKPEETYDIEKRVGFIREHKKTMGGVVIEIGGNTQGVFVKKLKQLFDAYYSFDVNMSGENTNNSVESLPVADVLISYYVFEHLVNIDELILEYTKHIKDDGVLIIEVPDAHLYYKNNRSLLFAEHVNHFTDSSLCMLIEKHGFKLLEISRYYASTNFGFCAAFIKAKPDSLQDNIEVIISKSLIKDGLRIQNNAEINKEKLTQRIKETIKNGKIPVMWCVSDTFRRFSEENEFIFSGDCILIDEDKRKRESYNARIINSLEASQLGVFENDTKYDIFIWSEEYWSGIVKSILKYNASFDIGRVRYVDQLFDLKNVKQKKG